MNRRSLKRYTTNHMRHIRAEGGSRSGGEGISFPHLLYITSFTTTFLLHFKKGCCFFFFLSFTNWTFTDTEEQRF